MPWMKLFLCLCLLMLVVTVSAYADDCHIVRYVDNLDGTMTDCRSNLIWLKNANCRDVSNSILPDSILGVLTWYDAMIWVKGLQHGICGLTDGSSAGDWRLPTKTEWMAMVISAKKQSFTWPALTNAAGTAKWADEAQWDFQDVMEFYYWSSTTSPFGTGHAWYLYMVNGSWHEGTKGNYFNFWPVRGGQSASFDSLTLE